MLLPTKKPEEPDSLTTRAHFGNGLIHRCLGASADGDAIVQQAFGDGAADAACAAGDEGVLALEGRGGRSTHYRSS